MRSFPILIVLGVAALQYDLHSGSPPFLWRNSECDPETMIRHPQKMCNLSNRKLFGQGDGKSFKQQGEATTGVGSGHLNLCGLSTTTGNTRECSMDECLVLEKVKMLPGAGFPVMDRLISFSTNRTNRTISLTNAAPQTTSK